MSIYNASKSQHVFSEVGVRISAARSTVLDQQSVVIISIIYLLEKHRKQYKTVLEFVVVF
jgi:hypothetical protein